MIAADLFRPMRLGADVARPEMDPFTEADALQEAALMDMRWVGWQSSLGMIFDLAGALQLRLGRTAILIVHGVDHFDLSRQEHLRGRVWYSVVRSSPELRGTSLRLELGLVPNAALTVGFTSGEFYVGDISGTDPDAPPPDLTVVDDDEAWASLPSWESEFVPGYATYLEPHPDVRN